MNILKLIKSKNRILEKFLSESKNFLDETINFNSVFFAKNLELLDKKRNKMIQSFKMYDRKIIEIRSKENNSLYDNEISDLFLDQKKIFSSILKVDEQIFKKIEKEKLKLSDELKESEKIFIATNKFKSSWIKESGEKLDHKL